MPTILVVDDEHPILNILQIILGKQKYIVETADAGNDAMFKLEFIMPDLVILDDMLPDMTGGDICLWIKQTYPHIPVLMCSAGARVRDAGYIELIGADDVILKPFKAQEVVEKVNRFFHVSA
ncbi:MAG: response regulator [Anaerolineae bacterium]|nr:response regulator [Anaerolineae bacterium]